MPTTATPQPGAPVDPYRAYNFRLLINIDRPAVILGAVRLGSVRLIDNVHARSTHGSRQHRQGLAARED